jgi:ParB family chromosome partitioning protein
VALGPTGIQVDPAALTTSEGRRLAVPALLARKDMAPLASLAGNPKPEVKLEAWAALGRLGGDDAAKLLHTSAFDKSLTVEQRKAAWRAHKRARRAAERAARNRKEGTPS